MHKKPRAPGEGYTNAKRSASARNVPISSERQVHPMISERLERQMTFIIEVEKLKAIYRQNMVVDKSRHENSAEHSWHLALMAVILADEAIDPAVDIRTVVEMLLIHDIVEIDAGDTFLYDATGNMDKEERENAAARRIFGLLPADQCEHCIALWKEFDERKTPSALFASAIDNMQPVLNHYASEGHGIRNKALKTRQVVEKKEFIKEASPALWEYTRATIGKSEAAGYYSPE
jgi:putative hydrolase of HD superfamily